MRWPAPGAFRPLCATCRRPPPSIGALDNPPRSPPSGLDAPAHSDLRLLTGAVLNREAIQQPLLAPNQQTRLYDTGRGGGDLPASRSATTNRMLAEYLALRRQTRVHRRRKNTPGSTPRRSNGRGWVLVQMPRARLAAPGGDDTHAARALDYGFCTAGATTRPVGQLSTPADVGRRRPTTAPRRHRWQAKPCPPATRATHMRASLPVNRRRLACSASLLPCSSPAAVPSGGGRQATSTIRDHEHLVSGEWSYRPTRPLTNRTASRPIRTASGHAGVSSRRRYRARCL